ncbi:MAG: DUF4238 domain-containing protein [Marivivens sp.]|uniref:DUF4238 domain-containing protein n=1 Tax=Marivivens sp. TaxID=1978374 RepID=UPI0017A49706|nr:DUF4238 domain-containing protein [Marivivens sp.]NVJ96492.1 DUF4238 domain-containing protein [Marivivens sp.]
MAGKNQHHIWQMVQRGFSHKEFKADQIWVYEKGKSPRRTQPKNYGSENHFYGEVGSRVDQKLTNLENELSELIHLIRNSDCGTFLDGADTSKLISLLTMRSLSLRDQLKELSRTVFKELSRIGKDERIFKDLMLGYIKQNPDFGTDIVPMLLQDGRSEEQARDLIVGAANYHIETQTSDLAVESATIIDLILSSIPDFSMKVHLAALEKDFLSSKLVDKYEGMSFIVQRAEVGSFILPDIGVIFLDDESAYSFPDGSRHPSEVIIPISSDVLVVGAKSRCEIRSIKTIRRLLASCAHKTFIAPVLAPELDRMSNLIGKNSKLGIMRTAKRYCKLETMLVEG